MRKLLLVLAASSSASAFATSHTAFQKFDNQYNLGYSMDQMTLSNGAQNQTTQNSQYLSLEIEHLFNNGVWLDAVGNLATSTSSLGNEATGTGQGATPTSQNPNLGGVNVKVGYAFPLLNNHIQLTPYGLVGRNTNLSYSTIIATTDADGTQNITNDYYYTAGMGGRIEYRINTHINLYLDQLISYNWDQSAPLDGVMPQNTMNYTTTLGAKFNIVENFQMGVNTFVTNYQYMAAAPTASASLNGGTSNGQYVTVYQPQYDIGAMITVGLTY